MSALAETHAPSPAGFRARTISRYRALTFAPDANSPGQSDEMRELELGCGVTITISRAFGDDVVSEICERVERFMQSTPDRLTRVLRNIVFPSVSPTVLGWEDWVVGSADPPGRMFIWPDPLRNFTQVVFDQELAHLVGSFDAMPRPLLKRWEKARERDSRAYKRPWKVLLRRRTGQHCYLSVNDVINRNLDPSSGWISSYAAHTEKVSEDWAETVSLYLYAERHRGLYTYRGYRVRFSALAPHRRRVIRQWLRAGDYGVRR